MLNYQRVFPMDFVKWSLPACGPATPRSPVNSSGESGRGFRLSSKMKTCRFQGLGWIRFLRKKESGERTSLKKIGDGSSRFPKEHGVFRWWPTTTFFVVKSSSLGATFCIGDWRVGLEETISGGCGYWDLWISIILNYVSVMCWKHCGLGLVCSLKKKTEDRGEKRPWCPIQYYGWQQESGRMSCEANHQLHHRLPHLRFAQRPHGVRHAAVAALGQFQVTWGEGEEVFLAATGWQGLLSQFLAHKKPGLLNLW